MSLLERILDSFLLFCYPMLPISCCRYVSISVEFLGFRGKKLKKAAKNSKKCRVLGPKTSDFLGTNLRTFDAKPPYFVAKKSDVSGFPAGNAAKIPLFPILRYLGPRLGVVASVALLRALTTGFGRLEASGKRASENIAHSSGCSESEAWFTALDFILRFLAMAMIEQVDFVFFLLAWQ